MCKTAFDIIMQSRTSGRTIKKPYVASPDGESDPEVKQPPRKKARDDPDSGDNDCLPMPRLGTRPTPARNSSRMIEGKKNEEKEKEKDGVNKGPTGSISMNTTSDQHKPRKIAPLREAISMQRKHTRLLEEADADLQKKDARIDVLQAENARLEEDCIESKRAAANTIHQVLQLRKVKEDLIQENKELEKRAKAGNELVQTKEMLKKAIHEAMEWKREKEKLENRVKALEATIAEYAKFVDGVRTGLPGLERSLSSVPGAFSA